MDASHNYKGSDQTQKDMEATLFRKTAIELARDAVLNDVPAPSRGMDELLYVGNLERTLMGYLRWDANYRAIMQVLISEKKCTENFVGLLTERCVWVFNNYDRRVQDGRRSVAAGFVQACADVVREVIEQIEEYRQRSSTKGLPRTFNVGVTEICTLVFRRLCQCDHDLFARPGRSQRNAPSSPKDRNLFANVIRAPLAENTSVLVLDVLKELASYLTEPLVAQLREVLNGWQGDDARVPGLRTKGLSETYCSRVEAVIDAWTEHHSEEEEDQLLTDESDEDDEDEDDEEDDDDGDDGDDEGAEASGSQTRPARPAGQEPPMKQARLR